MAEDALAAAHARIRALEAHTQWLEDGLLIEQQRADQLATELRDERRRAHGLQEALEYQRAAVESHDITVLLHAADAARLREAELLLHVEQLAKKLRVSELDLAMEHKQVRRLEIALAARRARGPTATKKDLLKQAEAAREHVASLEEELRQVRVALEEQRLRIIGLEQQIRLDCGTARRRSSDVLREAGEGEPRRASQLEVTAYDAILRLLALVHRETGYGGRTVPTRVLAKISLRVWKGCSKPGPTLQGMERHGLLRRVGKGQWEVLSVRAVEGTLNRKFVSRLTDVELSDILTEMRKDGSLQAWRSAS